MMFWNPFEVRPAEDETFTVFVERLNEAREHSRIGRSKPAIESDTHITGTRREPGRPPRRSASLEVQASKEIPCNLRRIIRIPKFNRLFIDQLCRHSVFHHASLDRAP